MKKHNGNKMKNTLKPHMRVVSIALAAVLAFAPAFTTLADDTISGNSISQDSASENDTNNTDDISTAIVDTEQPNESPLPL